VRAEQVLEPIGSAPENRQGSCRIAPVVMLSSRFLMMHFNDGWAEIAESQRRDQGCSTPSDDVPHGQSIGSGNPRPDLDSLVRCLPGDRPICVICG
jgi:hypothetical protein